MHVPDPAQGGGPGPHACGCGVCGGPAGPGIVGPGMVCSGCGVCGGPAGPGVGGCGFGVSGAL
eukprot:9830586-Alexandrium_andersonii.AAC.1